MMMRASWSGCLWLLLIGAAACTQKVELYCDENTPCTDQARPFCDLDGEFPASEGITNTCIPDPPPDGGAPVSCTPNEIVCENDELITCGSDGLVDSTEQCPLGCHRTEQRCNQLDPSNGLAAQLDEAEDGPDLVLNNGATVDTTSGEILNGNGSPVSVPSSLLPAQAGGVDVRVFMMRSLRAGDVVITGLPAVAFVSSGDIDLSGDLVLAPGTQGGPGSITGDSVCHAADTDAEPTGGGGFGTAGGNGGPGGTTGGLASGNDRLVPLRGGCRGGTAPAAQGGRGGGAIHIVSRTKIQVGAADAASIQAHGAGGRAGNAAGCQVCIFTSAGGGAGGGVLLEAPDVRIGDQSAIVANGGGGACPTEHGAPGTLGVLPAAGGSCPSGVIGGAGGSRISAASGGIGNAGGGGASGRIRINTADGMFTADPAAILSPVPSPGIAATR